MTFLLRYLGLICIMLNFQIGISAKYFYKNNSIYFDHQLDLAKLTDVAIHECIHYLQEKRDKKGNILKLGLCDYTDSSLPGNRFK